MYASAIVKYINAVLEQRLSSANFRQGKYYGIAQIAKIKESDDSVSMKPVIFDNEGIDINKIIDDVYSFVVYHRTLAFQFANIDNNQKFSFGDGASNKTQIINMVMVVYGDREKLQITQEQFTSLIYFMFPSEVLDEVKSQMQGVQTLTVSPVSSNNVSLSVMQQEGIMCEQENILFSIQYQIRMQVNGNCFNDCGDLDFCI